MITSLTIQNIALISDLCLRFDKGLTVLSGETGSGKSIIIDSLAFVLGERADKSMIKYGEDRASVEVVFTVDSNSRTQLVLEELGFESDNTVVISRTMTMSGRNECRINGKNCSASMLKSISSTLVDIFGQSQHLNLLKVDNHIEILDGFADFGSLLVEMKQLYQQYRTYNKQLKEVGGSESERARQLDILQFQINELKTANLSCDEEAYLESEHKRIVNMERIVNALSLAQQHLSDNEPSIIGSLAIANSSLSAVIKFDEQLVALTERINAMRLEATDISDTVQQMLSSAHYSVGDVDTIENRLEFVRNIKRKYGGRVEEALKFLQQAEQNFELLSNASEIFEQLNNKIDKLTERMFELANRISQIRRATAAVFSEEIMQQLSDLGMNGSNFVVQFGDAPTLQQYRQGVSPYGYDKLEFLLSANIGEPLKPLVKVISGGEMSRFMLAVKNITATVENIPTMIFDEIDTGISGKIAQKIAEKLAKVSNNYQCIVITHLPQIVAMGDNNLLIAKSERNGRTTTNVVTLTDVQDKAQEVARLMGGIGEHALVNALEIISHCQQVKTAFIKSV